MKTTQNQITDSKLSALENPFSYFPKVWLKASSETTTVFEMIDRIRSDEFAELVEKIRREPDNRKRHELKKKLPCASVSGIVDGLRKKAHPEERFTPNGLLACDFDIKDFGDRTAEQIRTILEGDEHCLAVFESPSGGIKAILAIPVATSDDDFKRIFRSTEGYFLKDCGLKMDTSTKDSARLTYYSHDPKAWLRDGSPKILPISPQPFDPVYTKSESTTKPEIPTCELPFEDVPEDTSEEVIARLIAKSPLTAELWQGNWEGNVGPSQSEADFSFACSICEETPCLSQQDEIFRLSGLSRNDHKTERALRAARKQVAENARLQATWQIEETTVRYKPLAEFLVNHGETLGMSWKEIEALRPPYIIDEFVRCGEVLLLGAESKSRKSWLVQDAGFAVASGIPWLADVEGNNGFKTRKARVHVVDLELNPSEMRYRFAKARRNRFANFQDAADMTSMVTSYSLDGKNVKEIMRLVEELKPTVAHGDLVIVDCLYRLCPDGNEVAPLAEILEAMKRFASETQAGLILVDHFRKAGDEKARNRFAGSFVKQASASTLVAIEVTSADILVLNLDARTFHGRKRVYAQFNPETYAFDQMPEVEAQKEKQKQMLELDEDLVRTLWKGRTTSDRILCADAVERWGVKRQTATLRLSKLVSRGWLHEERKGVGKATEWTLTPDGGEVIKGENNSAHNTGWLAPSGENPCPISL